MESAIATQFTMTAATAGIQNERDKKAGDMLQIIEQSTTMNLVTEIITLQTKNQEYFYLVETEEFSCNF